ncbi:MAG: SoxR reducing system RseC family protein [Betaproteobacteria bacterium]|nr:SoxR reducing system RseC family protein [Betaproteobacteria bacterium]
MEMNARVLVVEADHTIWVEALPNTQGCSSCSSSQGTQASGCGADNIGRMFTGNAPHRFRVIDTMGCQTGDQVLIEIEDGSVLRSAFVVYLLPIGLVFFGAILASHLSTPVWSDLASILGAGLGLMVAAVWLWQFNLRVRHNPKYQPVVLRKLYTASFVLQPH